MPSSLLSPNSPGNPAAPSDKIKGYTFLNNQSRFTMMWHLVQVKKKDPEGKAYLQLLAQQKAEHAWTVMTDEGSDLYIDTPIDGFTESDGYLEGALLLVELTATRQIQKVQDATPWVLELIEQYLGAGISPALLQEEVQRAEQWRQSLTLKSQELQRRALEMEARREQIQELEENLKQEKETLEALAAQLKSNLDSTEEQQEQQHPAG